MLELSRDRMKGATYSALAALHGVSTKRIQQVIKKWRDIELHKIDHSCKTRFITEAIQLSRVIRMGCDYYDKVYDEIFQLGAIKEEEK